MGIKATLWDMVSSLPGQVPSVGAVCSILPTSAPSRRRLGIQAVTGRRSRITGQETGGAL